MSIRVMEERHRLLGVWVFLLVAASMLLPAGPVRTAEPPLGGAWIGAFEGDVRASFAEDPGWRPAETHTPLLPDDRVWVAPGSRAEVCISGGGAIYLGSGSSARFVRVPFPDEDQPTHSEVALESGTAIAALGDGNPSRPLLALTAPDTRLWIYPRSLLRVKILTPAIADVVLQSGSAIAEVRGVAMPLRAGSTLRVDSGTASSRPASAPDAFDAWAADRARAVAGIPSAPVELPPPLAPSAADLSRYGEWFPVPEYGVVWRPAAVAADWAPFARGRWLWRHTAWVWIPEEPWGWLPFHYGRWRKDVRWGWYWVPPARQVAVWCPGAVAWSHAPTHATWTPLPPGEPYHGPRGHGNRPASPPAALAIRAIRAEAARTSASVQPALGASTSPHRDVEAHRNIAPIAGRTTPNRPAQHAEVRTLVPVSPAPAPSGRERETPSLTHRSPTPSAAASLTPQAARRPPETAARQEGSHREGIPRQDMTAPRNSPSGRREGPAPRSSAPAKVASPHRQDHGIERSAQPPARGEDPKPAASPHPTAGDRTPRQHAQR
jgi:hypothetical protein